MTFLMTGLDVRDRLVVLVGGGDVTARRAERLLGEGAVLRIIAPEITARTAALVRAGSPGSPGSPGDHGACRTLRGRPPLSPGRSGCTVTWIPRGFRESDLAGAWLVHTATGDPQVDEEVDRACRERRIWCVDAASAPRGSARIAATVSRDGVSIGTLSSGEPDPRRTAGVSHRIRDLLDKGLLPTAPVRRSGSAGDRSGSTEVTQVGQAASVQAVNPHLRHPAAVPPAVPGPGGPAQPRESAEPGVPGVPGVPTAPALHARPGRMPEVPDLLRVPDTRGVAV